MYLQQETSWTRHFTTRILLLILAIATLLGSAMGQTNQGSIAGNVSDPSGALVPDAKITAKGVSTGSTYETVSGSSGSYRIPNMNIGTYDITVTASGFKTATLTGVLVQVATTSSLDIKLTAGGITENVIVNADAPRVQSESSEIGAVISQKQTLDLPLALGSTVQAMRSPEAFVFLTPGAVGPGSDSGNGGTFEAKITGGQNYATEVLLDGAGTTRSENGSSFDETAPSVEALSEFKVITSTLPAEFGRTTGGIESFNTKGGTNNYHGTAYELFRNEALDANFWGNDYNINNHIGQKSQWKTPLDRQNDYGGALGGPLSIPHLYNGKDKTFFFFSWEQYRQQQGGVSPGTVPTAKELTGDFSEQLGSPILDAGVPEINPCDGSQILNGQIFDPATTQLVGSTLCRTAFPGNIIPSGRFSTVGQTLQTFYPKAQNGDLANNFLFPFSFPILDTTTTFRIDQNISTKSKAYFTYSSRENVRISTQPAFDGPAGAGRNQFFGTHYIRFGYDYTISPTLLNHLSLGYNRTNSKNVGAAVGLGNGTDWDAQIGIGGAGGKLFPQVNNSQTPTQLGDNVYGDTIDNGFRFADTLNWVKGKHEIKIGYEQWYQQYSPLNFQNTEGTFDFASAQTAVSNSTGIQNNLTGNGFASMLLGAVNTSSVSSYAGQARWVRNYYAGFIQDSFKIKPTLVLNYGLRYEIDQPFKEAYGDTSTINISQPNPGAGNLPGVLEFAGKGTGRNGNNGETWANAWKKGFGPRVGFAWSPSVFNSKTVFRGGYGIIYGGLQYADFGADNRTGFAANPQFNTPDGFNPAFTIDAGFPAYPAPPNLDPTQLNPNAGGGFQGPTYIDPSYGRTPMIQNWSVEVQHEIVTDLIFDLAYVGEHSTHLRSNFNAVNSLNPKYFGLGGLLNQGITTADAVTAGFTPPYAGFPSGATVAQSLVPFPMYGGFNTDCCLEDLGQSTYNALEASLNRRFHNGLNLMASYTWSKTLTDADAALPFFATLHQGGAPQNPFNKDGDKAISNQDLPQNFVVSYIYELPLGRNKKFLNSSKALDKVVGGWSFSGVQRYESGQPIAFGCATGVPAFAGCIRFDQVPGSSIFSSAYKSGHWDPATQPIFNSLDNVGPVLNPAAFDDPNSGDKVAARGYAFGTLPRVDGAIRMSPYMSEDFNLLKRTKITEGSDLLLQVSFLNAFNRHIWNRPGDLNPYDSRLNPGCPAVCPTTQFGLVNINALSNTGGGGYLLLPRKIQLQLKFEF